MNKTRFNRLYEYLERTHLSGMIFVDMKNVRYFAGFTGSDGALVVGPGGGVFLTDGRYTTQASGEVSSFPVVEYRSKIEGICDAVKRLKIKRIGVESHVMTVFLFDTLKGRLPGKSLVAVKDDISRLRMVKDDEEISLLREAVRISEDSMKEVEGLVKVGVREEEIAVELEYAMKKKGCGQLPFPIIVASGENGAMPHAHAGARKLTPGDLVTIDFGAEYRGYHSDETITLAVDHEQDRAREIYEIVLEAQRQGIATIKPGVSVKEVDKAARTYIEERGYGDYFSHGTGHGVGLEIHEPPRVSPLGEEVLEEGMIITVEPGIYIPGWGGVRIEDMVLVGKQGAYLLTTIPKSFRVLT
jgi:Xaa-Pro aminopeptidase